MRNAGQSRCSHTCEALQLKVLLTDGAMAACEAEAGLSDLEGVATEQAEEPLREEKVPPSKDKPVSIISAEMFSQARKVRSLAKNVFGSTRDLTRAFDLHPILL